MGMPAEERHLARLQALEDLKHHLALERSEREMADMDDIPHDAPFVECSSASLPTPPLTQMIRPSDVATVAQESNNNNAGNTNNMNYQAHVRDEENDDIASSGNANASANNSNEMNTVNSTPLADSFTDTTSAGHLGLFSSPTNNANTAARRDAEENNNNSGNPNPSPAHLNIGVRSDNTIMNFKIKPTTKLGKVMSAFCDRQGMNMDTVRFYFDGVRVEKEMTPAVVCFLVIHLPCLVAGTETRRNVTLADFCACNSFRWRIWIRWTS